MIYDAQRLMDRERLRRREAQARSRPNDHVSIDQARTEHRSGSGSAAAGLILAPRLATRSTPPANMNAAKSSADRLILSARRFISPLAALSAVLALLGVSSLTWGRSLVGGLFSFKLSPARISKASALRTGSRDPAGATPFRRSTSAPLRMRLPLAACRPPLPHPNRRSRTFSWAKASSIASKSRPGSARLRTSAPAGFHGVRRCSHWLPKCFTCGAFARCRGRTAS